MNLADDFFVQSVARPLATALHVQARDYSYRELAELSAKIAGWIRNCNLPKDARVGILGGRSADVYAGVLGACWAGTAYVPLSTTYPETRLLKLLEIACLDALIVDEAGQRLLNDRVLKVCPKHILAPDSHETGQAEFALLASAALRGVNPLDRPVGREPNSLAYMIFTSGTTGVPKGVMISLANVRHLIPFLNKQYRLGPEDRVSQFHELAFDLSVMEMFLAWGAGAALYIVPDLARMAPAKFIIENELTVWSSVPSSVALMDRLKQLRPGAFPSLRVTSLCGEPLPVELARAWQRAAPRSRLDNHYGPTEATVVCLVESCTASIETTAGRNTVAIGWPFPGIRAAILDKHHRFLPAGETGELALSGSQVALGYWNDAELTARKFPMLRDAQGVEGRWYLTGDLAYADPSGRYHHLGRIDNQVKILGHRVELEEIEAHLRAVCGTEWAAAIAWPVDNGSARGVVGFVSPCSPSNEEIREHLRRLLPPYMVPSQVLQLETLPYTVSGKVDRKKLVDRMHEGKGTSG